MKPFCEFKPKKHAVRVPVIFWNMYANVQDTAWFCRTDCRSNVWSNTLSNQVFICLLKMMLCHNLIRTHLHPDSCVPTIELQIQFALHLRTIKTCVQANSWSFLESGLPPPTQTWTKVSLPCHTDYVVFFFGVKSVFRGPLYGNSLKMLQDLPLCYYCRSSADVTIRVNRSMHAQQPICTHDF